MSKFKFKDLIQNFNHSDIDDFDIIISKVLIIKESMKVIVVIQSNKFINDTIFNKIVKIFENKFHIFKIDLNIIYPLDNLEEIFLEEYINDIKEIFKIKIPSSSSWIKDLQYKISDKNLIISFPNELALLSVERSNIIDKISKKIKMELNIDLKMNYNISGETDNDGFLETIKNEEKIISKKIISEINDINSSTNKTRKSSNFKFGKNIRSEPMKISEITLQSGDATVEGNVFEIESREIKGNRYLITIFISDGTDSIPIKAFLSKEQVGSFLKNIKEDTRVLAKGEITFDNYSKSKTLMLNSLVKVKKEERLDLSDKKRVELHLHTKMSSMDGITDLETLVMKAKKWGHKAVAITDHGVVQAFPEAMNLSNKYGIKFIYGIEGYLVNDKKDIVINYNNKKEYTEFIIFDIETTGLSAINDEITEIGAIKIKDGEIIDTFSHLINPGRGIPEFITNLTGITNEMVKNKPFIDEIIPLFYNFIGDTTLVAHNASFDVGFIREKLEKNNLKLNNPILDTLELSRAVFPNLKNHKLNNLAKHLDIELLNHHRALDDATATGQIFLKIMDLLNDKEIKTFDGINNLKSEKNSSKDVAFHIVLLAKNTIGLKNLYKLVSESHINNFYRRPRIPKSLLEEHREGLLIGSACEAGELFKGILNNKSYSEIRDIVKFYDYLEIQPIENNMHLVRNKLVKDKIQLQKINRQIYELGEKYNKPVVATGDVHFLEPEDEIFRKVLMVNQGFQDADLQPPLYFKTTEEMLTEFSYLGEKTAYDVVVKNTNLINDLIENIKPIPEGTFPPIIDGAEDELTKITYERAYSIYGDPLPEIVEKRLKKELDSIIKNGYAVMYIIAQKLVWKSNNDGYLVGSRGSVGSSFAATMGGITEVNPLPPHYICLDCRYSEFFISGEISSGIDLPEKNCPVCNSPLQKDGQDIPFEVFLGFEGDKEPDIDLNFAGEYQIKAHKYIEDLFGKEYVFRAGTIGTIAEKTAYGFVKKYFDEIEINASGAEINRLLKGCTGIRRSTGQHPGGVMIVPKHKDILDFTPVQYPANDSKSGVITTHFDYNAISGRILKLDILGHDVPSIIKMLEEITGIDPTSIPLDESNTMKIFSGVEPLNVSEKEIDCKVGTLGIPEFGTKFVRQMLVDTRPNKFSELVRISGLSHGTDVWMNNAQELVRNNRAKLSDVISTREDIMLYLINAGLEKKKSFHIMENVRRGKGLSQDDEKDMLKLSLPDWYIESCNKIKYMFPKAHAVAYVMMSFRIAFFKVHHPEAFYATYFTTKANDFDAQLILSGIDQVSDRIKELESYGNKLTDKEKNLLTILEVVREMYHRGMRFKGIDLYESDSDKFIIKENSILPPLKALVGVGENAARKIVFEREISRFMSIEDLISRGKVTKTVIEALDRHGCLKELPQSNQINLFNV